MSVLKTTKQELASNINIDLCLEGGENTWDQGREQLRGGWARPSRLAAQATLALTFAVISQHRGVLKVPISQKSSFLERKKGRQEGVCSARDKAIEARPELLSGRRRGPRNSGGGRSAS